MEKEARKAHGEQGKPASLGNTQAELDESVTEAYQRIVLGRTSKPDPLCAWCGEKVGKSYVSDGVDLYHDELDRNCYALSMKHGTPCSSR